MFDFDSGGHLNGISVVIFSSKSHAARILISGIFSETFSEFRVVCHEKIYIDKIPHINVPN